MARAYCNETCRDSYRCDRRQGAFYPAISILRPDAPVEGPIVRERDVMRVVPWEEYAMQARVCRYCQRPLPKESDRVDVPEGQLNLPPEVLDATSSSGLSPAAF